MKKGLLGSTALIGATVLMAGAANVASAAEAPEYKLSGNLNFQIYLPDQDTPSGTIDSQDRAAYFSVNDPELVLNVSGSTDNGLDYGFKVELQINTDDGTGTGAVSDEARMSLGGSWGTIQLGDEDGAEDSMNYGGENLMGATGGFDGDQDAWYNNIGTATSFPTIAGDTSDATKITYYSPRTSGIQVGASWTPNTGATGNNSAANSGDENHFGLGANYDGEMGGMRIRASAVYSMETAANPLNEDTGAFSVGGIVNFGQIGVGANYTDNGDVGLAAAPDNSSYFDVGASFSQGPIGVAVGYLSSTYEFNAGGEDTYSHIALTADYSMAPGLGVYAEIALVSSETGVTTNDGTGITVGANVSF